ncbi:MAG: hypothetical protein FJ090_02125 [Deltaproteobacteria bacterium]|nr:hypothetical protein [Deltaproteobacteria bacterium]
MILLLLACAAGSREWTFDESPDAVVATFGNGEVNVLTTETDGASVLWEGASLGTIPHVGVLDAVLLVGAECRACGGSLDIEVPAGTPLDVTLGEGAVKLELAEPSDVLVDLDHGSVEIVLPTGDYDLAFRAGVGSLTLDGVAHDAEAPNRIDITLRAGDIHIAGR